MKLMRPGEVNKRGNIVTARLVPIFLLGIIGYSSWVLTAKVCVDYLLRPSPSLVTRRDTGAAVAVLTIFYLLLLLTLISFGRLGQTILVNPGLVPRGPQYWVEKERKRREEIQGDKEDGALDDSPERGYTPRHHRRRRHLHRENDFRAGDFWHKDVFVCGWDGRPPFCSTCYNYKPDRAHHCSELGRCVLKMDHFCPWVGGIVSETSFKFFIQFTGWAALFCLHTLVVMSYYLARRRGDQPGFLNVHWILTLIFAGLFFVFSAGMCGSSLQFAFLNSTTIENFTRKTKIWYLAVHVPAYALEKYHSSGRSDLRFITYPRPPSEQFEVLQQSGATLNNDNDSEQNVPPQREEWERDVPQTPTAPPNTYAPQSQSSQFPPHPAVARTIAVERPGSASMAAIEPRTFAILETAPGANPFDVGPLGNFKEVMGSGVLDWIFPLRPSPLLNHGDPTSIYKLGPVVGKLKRKAGITDRESGGDGVYQSDEKARTHRREKRRHRRHRHSHHSSDPTTSNPRTSPSPE